MIADGVTLPAIPGGWTTRDFVLAGRTLRVTLPSSPDAFLDDPEVLAANRRDDYMPYWSYLWPTSLETAVAVLHHDWSQKCAGIEQTLPRLRKGGAGGVGVSLSHPQDLCAVATSGKTTAPGKGESSAGQETTPVDP